MKRFKEYPHSRAIVMSHLNNQYKSEIRSTDMFSILFTRFDYHYVVGNPPADVDQFIDVIRGYVVEYDSDELILFAENKEWELYLEDVFTKINGVVDKRHSFQLNKEKFYDVLNSHVFKNEVNVKLMQDEASAVPYPVAEVVINGEVVSYCKGFMTGDNNVEIDVYTEKEHRNKQMAFECSLRLIEHILNNNSNPRWNTWANKTGSQRLAEKCGFEFEQEVPAYIWVKDFGVF